MLCVCARGVYYVRPHIYINDMLGVRASIIQSGNRAVFLNHIQYWLNVLVCVVFILPNDI